MEKKINVGMYKGMPAPTVELDSDELPTDQEAADSEAPNDDMITVSLDSLEAVTGGEAHNQSYGMAQGSTGCVSNPGGPSC